MEGVRSVHAYALTVMFTRCFGVVRGLIPPDPGGAWMPSVTFVQDPGFGITAGPARDYP
jgi:hypothetical protein